MCQNSIRNQFWNILQKANFIPETSLFAFPFFWKNLSSYPRQGKSYIGCGNQSDTEMAALVLKILLQICLVS